MTSHADKPTFDGKETARQPYSPPVLIEHGTVAELTRTGTGSLSDGGGPFAFSGTGGLYEPTTDELGG